MTVSQVTTATDPVTSSWRRRVLNWHSAVAKRYVLPPTALWELAGVLLAISAGVLAHAWNLFNYPRYTGDEGTYMSSAWAITHGMLYPYTYGYGHPPLGWILIAAWCELTGGFFTFGTAINTGRVLMLVIYACSALCVYLICRRLTGSAWAALLATTLFSFCPLSLYYQRLILLDNFAILWVLAAFYLQISSAGRLRYLAGSAFTFGIGILSKETMVVLFPVFLYGTWLQVSRFQRRYALIMFGYVTLALGSTYVLYAELKNELFPTGTLLGGNTPHVSMLTTLLGQVGRGSSQGSFGAQWRGWLEGDALFMVGGLISVAGNLVLGWRRPVLRVLALLPLIYLVFLARGGVTFGFYVIPLLPLLALNIAVFAYLVIALVLQVPWWANRALTRWITPAMILICIALFLPHDLRLSMNRKNLTANETQPQVAALQWASEHLPRSAEIIADHYNWLDMHVQGGLGAGYGAPFAHVDMYWQVDTDPAIHTKLLHDDWNNIDYIIADSELISDAKASRLTLVQAGLQHAVPIKTFQNRLYWVTIYEVQHRGQTDTSTPTLIQEVNQPPAPPKKGSPGPPSVGASSSGG